MRVITIIEGVICRSFNLSFQVPKAKAGFVSGTAEGITCLGLRPGRSDRDLVVWNFNSVTVEIYQVTLD